MATRPRSVLLTYDDYRLLPDDRNRYELLEGGLAVTPAPSTSHQGVVLNLALLITPHVRQQRLGQVLIAPCDVLLSDVTVVEPDLLFVARERLAIVEVKYVHGAPDLVVEVLSPTTARRDRQTKAKIYASYGVPNYWLFDPRRREAAAWVLDRGAYRRVLLAKNGDAFTAPPFPDLTLSLTEVWSSGSS